MNIKQTIITATVALTMAAMIAPMSAGAVTIAELQAQINALLAQLQELQAMQGPVSGTPAVCAGVTFSRNLAVGATGSDVKCLQALLNTSASTQVSATGAGSPGNETTYFGSRTLAAAKVYQAANGITPADRVGPLTRAKLNAWLGGSPSTPSTPSTPTVPTGAGLSVMLASDNPATGTVVNASALHPMLKLVFLNGDNAEVKVTGLKLKRIGVSADASVTNTYLFKGAERLTDGSAVSETIVNFNSSTGLFMVPAGGSTTISVLSNVSGTASETVGMQVVEAVSVTSNASSVKGTYPLTGNLFTVATGTLAGVEWNATTTPAASSVDPQDGYTVFQNSVVVTTRAVDLKRISFRKTGSITDTDLQNFKLYIDGVQVGSTAQLAKDSTGSSYATFDLMSAPKRLEAGTRVVKVLADIIGGSSLTFTIYLWNVADVTVVDTQYNANVLSDLVSDATFSKRPATEQLQTINGGTVTFTKKTNSPSGDIVDAASNSLFGKWEVKAAGEKVKIETLNVRVIFGNTVTTGDNDVTATGDITIRNGKLLANGVQIGSTTSTINGAAGTQFSLGSSLIVDPMSPVTLEFWGDVYDNKGSANDIDATDTLQASIIGSSSNNNATGQVSANTIDAPAANVNANVLTVRQGTLTLAKYVAYTNNTAVAPLTAYKLGHFNLTAATSEAVNISTINVVLDEVSSYTTNLYVKYGTATTSTKPTVTATNTWSVNYPLAAGAVIDLTVFGDIASHTGTTGTVTVDVDSTTASSAVTADSAAVAGQDITYSTGTFASVLGPDTPIAKTVAGDQQVTAATFKFTASNEDRQIKELRFSVASAAISAVIKEAVLKDGSTELKRTPFSLTSNTIAHFTGLSNLISIPKNTSKTLTVDLVLDIPNATVGATSNRDVAVTLNQVIHVDSQGTETTVSSIGTAANTVLVYKSIPTFTVKSLSSSTLVTGTSTELYRFAVAANSKGPIAMKQLKFEIVIDDGSAGGTETLGTFKFFRGSSDLTSTVTIQNTTGETLEATNTLLQGTSTVAVTFDTEELVPAGGSYEYVLKAVPTTFASSTSGKDSISTSLLSDASAQTAGFNDLNAGTAITPIVKLHSAATASGSATDHNVIWSDMSGTSHSASVGTVSDDWTNGRLILDLPLDPKTTIVP